MHMKGKKRILLLCLCAALLLLAGTAIGVYARYVRHVGEEENTFSSAVSIKPTVRGGTSDVYIEVGDTDYPVYVRAAIVITWQNEYGIVYFLKPAATDYSLSLKSETGWTQGTDGYYYYKTPVKSGGQTAILIDRFTQTGAAPAEGYALNIEVIAQTVQAVGYTDGDGVNPATEIEAYKDAWGLS